MKTLIVGGHIGDPGRTSKIITQLATFLPCDVHNGGDLADLEAYLEQVSNYDLTVWCPDIDNEIEKQYPPKKIGSVLICSKVLRPDRDLGDAVARIFRMNANAVIAINSQEKPYNFSLIDALGNSWCRTTSIGELAATIQRFYMWSTGAKRIRTENIEIDKKLKVPDLTQFCLQVHSIADKVENERGGRFFGNCSTRCAKMFPSWRDEDSDLIWVSARNIPKSRISVNDFVPVREIGDQIFYQGLYKPSIDTPVQVELYRNLPLINYFIHGHAYVYSEHIKVLDTIYYYPCGDVREVRATLDVVSNELHFFALNLKRHGFLLGADNLTSMDKLIKNLKFQYRNLGEEWV